MSIPSAAKRYGARRSWFSAPPPAATTTILLALWFIGLACTLLPHAGIEGDEAFFAWPVYDKFQPNFGVTVFHHPITLMVFPYAGTLKTALYWPILKVFGPSVWALRLPPVLLGAATIVVFSLLVARLVDWTAALLSASLLATDPSFILTNTFDWGPVALEHLLFVGGCALAVYCRLELAAFCFGLALWNKAVFVWALAGLAAGALVAYFPEVRRRFNKATAVKCIGSFLLGALPLMVYNLRSPNTTASVVHPSFEGFSLKVSSLRQTLDGSVLFGILVSTARDGAPKQPHSAAGRLARRITQVFGTHQSSLFIYGLIAALLSLPVWWHSKARSAAIFSVICSIVSFLVMASVRTTGAAHHIVLLYPMPHLFLGATLSTWRPRWTAGGVGLLLIAVNLLVYSQYLFDIETYGAFGLFSDALTPLSAALPDSNGTVYTLDVLLGDTLDFMHEGRLPIQRATTLLSLPRADVAAMVENPQGTFVGRVAGREYYKGAGERLDSVAGELGYRRVLLQTVRDSNGRPQFEIFRYQHLSNDAVR